jgi:dimethylhistidine N-methyltransferase
VEFGAGALRKIRILLDALERPRGYCPIDISGPYLRQVVSLLAADYPLLAMHPVVGDFTLPLTLPTLPGAVRRAGFFPGSTIGNFRPNAAMAMLRRMREMLNGGGLLIGVDLVKDPQILHAAYKNLLARANRELGADFDLDGFAHYAPYNPLSQRVEMYLLSLKRQSVQLGETSISFAAGEAVHTEDSHKYTIESFREMAARAGFSPRAVWTDTDRLFAIHWLESR